MLAFHSLPRVVLNPLLDRPVDQPEHADEGEDQDCSDHEEDEDLGQAERGSYDHKGTSYLDELSGQT